MTSKKSIIEIDVQADTWKAFIAEYQKFRGARKESTAEAKEEAKAQKKLTDEKKKTAQADQAAAKGAKSERAEKAKADKEAAAVAKRKADAEKKDEENRRKTRAADLAHLKESAKWTADVAKNVASTAFNAAKWVAFSAIASGFGLGGLASSAGGARRASQGLGINTGELRAANVNFGKYIDPESALGNIAGAQSDLSKQWIFKALGQNTNGKNAGDLLPELLPKLIASFKAGGSTLQGAQGRGLTELVGIDDLRRLSTLTEKELSETIAAYKKDRASLDVDDATGRAWQDFLVSMKRAGEGIEVSLIKGLRTLTPFLESFAKGISAGIEAFASSGRLQEWIKALGAGLEKLGNYLGSKEFQDDVSTFMDAIHTMASYLGKLFPKKETHQASADPVAHATSGTAAAMGVYGAAWDHLMGKDRMGRVAALNGKYGLPAGLLDSVWDKESSRGQNPGVSSAGAAGDFQFVPGVAAQYGVKDRYNFDQSAEGAAKMLAYLMNKYAGDKDKALAGYNWGEGNVDRDVASHGSDWRRFAPKETQKYIGFKVEISNTTGGSAQASVAALTGG